MAEVTSDTLVITGGGLSGYLVTRYGPEGFLADLPRLHDGRSNHGCGAYLGQDGGQVLLVAGGFTESDNGGDWLASTELLTSQSSHWVYASSLPRKLGGLRGVAMGGVIYMTGTYNIYLWDSHSSYIYSRWPG